MSDFNNISTNIISGFLGSGKTTVIQYVLKHKPESEIWAVIVNEFGQIGVDGALLKNASVTIKEISGGCLCCVGSQSLNVGLNQIIRSVKPDRIIIEPTGLGHPENLIKTLTGEFYKSVLNLKAVINLVDARNLSDSRYLNNATFAEQSKLADVLLASKSDTYSKVDKKVFFDYACSFKPEKKQVEMIESGRIDLQWLDLCRLENTSKESNLISSLHLHIEKNMKTPKTDDKSDWQVREGKSDGYFSLGWKIKKSTIFRKKQIIKYMEKIFESGAIERVKGIINTDEGWQSINMTRYENNVSVTDARVDSVLEIISAESLNASDLNLALLKCCQS